MDKITNLIHEYIEDNGGSSLNENFLKDAFIKLFKNSFIWINKQIFGPEMGKLLDMYINGSLQIKKNFQAQLDKMSTIDLDEEFLTKYTLKFIDALKENANLAFVKNIYSKSDPTWTTKAQKVIKVIFDDYEKVTDELKKEGYSKMASKNKLMRWNIK